MLSFSVGNAAFSLSSLEPSLDDAFVRLYAARIGNADLRDIDFDAPAIAFLKATLDPGRHDQFFSNFTPLWKMYLASGSLHEAAGLWAWALRPALALEASSTQKIHKGTAYYFWGMTALLSDDLDRGYLLMHRGLEEDVRTFGRSDPQTPGFAFAALDHDKPDQAFRPWVQHQAAVVEKRLSQYCTDHSRHFDLTSLRSKFLSDPLLREPAYLYSYAMARTNRLLALPAQLWEGPFPAQIAFDVLFDLCLVVDEALRHKNPTQWRFIDRATFLSQHVGLGLSVDDLRAVNGLFEASFENSLQAALVGTLTLATGRQLAGLASSLAITYGCRNRGAHTVAAVPIVAAQFDSVIGRINDTLFLTVETLY